MTYCTWHVACAFHALSQRDFCFISASNFFSMVQFLQKNVSPLNYCSLFQLQLLCIFYTASGWSTSSCEKIIHSFNIFVRLSIHRYLLMLLYSFHSWLCSGCIASCSEFLSLTVHSVRFCLCFIYCFRINKTCLLSLIHMYMFIYWYSYRLSSLNLSRELSLLVQEHVSNVNFLLSEPSEEKKNIEHRKQPKRTYVY